MPWYVVLSILVIAVLFAFMLGSLVQDIHDMGEYARKKMKEETKEKR